MNRAQRRQAVKNLQKEKGYKRAEAKRLVETFLTDVPLEEGQKVKLNYELMIRHPDWKNQRDDFKEWCTAHKDDIFTVEWDKERKEKDASDKKLMVCLAEDETEPKWLFNTLTLTPIATARVKLDTTGEEVSVSLDGVDTKDSDAVNKAITEALEREGKDIAALKKASQSASESIIDQPLVPISG